LEIGRALRPGRSVPGEPRASEEAKGVEEVVRLET
jgi:hypothetical protein